MCQNWSERQKKIYEGLKKIGGEAAGFFKSALTCYYNKSFPNKVSFLAHAAREIDGGIRDIFSFKRTKKKGDYSSIQRSHINSILAVLNAEEREALAKEWFLVSKKLHKYAHRHGIWKQPRRFEEFKPLWDKYEEVLSKLVGSFYAIINIIDRLMQLEEINEASYGVLLNLICVKPYEDYFFRNVKNIKWFLPLVSNNIFQPKNIQFDDQGNALFWNVLVYLEWISSQISSLKPQEQVKYAKELIKIIDNTVNYSLKLKREKSKNKINHFHIWWFFVKIINNIPTELIVKESLFSIEQFRKWLFEFMDPEMTGDLPAIDITEKLLPKFLDNKDTVKFSEAIIDVITAIKKGGRKRPLINRDEAILVYSSSSYWIQDAFKKHSRKIGEVCSIDIIYTLTDRLNLALEYEQQDFFVDLKVKNERYRIKIERIPEEDLKEDEIKFKENTYTIIIRQFSQKQLREIDFDKDIWTRNIPEPEKFISRFSIVAENKQSFMEQIKSKLPSDINWQNAEDFPTRINNLFDGLYEDYSQIWCKSLDKGPEHLNDADDILTIILKDILLSKCKTDKESGNRVLKDFLSDKYKFPVFKRFVILCIDKLWKDYQELLKEVLERMPDILEEPDYEVEIFDLLKNHHNEFDSEIIPKLKELIERIPQYYREKNLEDYWRYKWYSPLKDNKEFKDLYVKAREKVRPKDDKPYEPEHASFKGGLITHKSPLSKEKILEMPIAELVKFLNEFKGADFWEGTFEGKPDKQGLAETLREAVKENPEKFVKEIDLFYNAPYFYVNHLFWGLRDAFNAGKDFTPLWGEIFKFSLRYVKKSTFLKEAFESQRGDSGKGKYISVVDGIVDLIETGSKDDSKAFSPEYFDIVKQIFDAVTPLPKVELHPDTQRDALTYALNTTFGRIVISFIVFSLQVRRVTKQEEKDWGENNYERFFERQGIEAWIWFGRFLPNIRYLDEEYAKKKIKEFLEEYNVKDFRWKVFMEGYLTSPYVYDDIYKLMRPHYLRAIENKVLPEDIDYRLVQHICIGYLRGYELLERKNKDGEDSLFWKILEDAGVKEKHDRWLEVINFFWSISERRVEGRKKDDRNKPSVDIKEKVLRFWGWTFDNQDYIKEMLGEDYEKFLAKLANLTIYLDRIDRKNKEWLLLSAPYVYKERHARFFIEYLTKFKDDNSVKHLGEIFLKILENSTPIYRQEDIQLIVERLYKLWQRDKEKYKEIKEDADEICNTYGRRGVHFLKELYMKYSE